MSTISVSVQQRSTSFSIYLSASTSNGVVWLPGHITAVQGFVWHLHWV